MTCDVELCVGSTMPMVFVKDLMVVFIGVQLQQTYLLCIALRSDHQRCKIINATMLVENRTQLSSGLPWENIPWGELSCVSSSEIQ